MKSIRALVIDDDELILRVESLARWNIPGYGMVTPDEFIPLAEKFGLIDELTDLVMRKSL